MAATAVNEVGNRYGRLLVLKRSGTNRKGRATWLCRCDCENEVIITGSYLRRGQRKSCGCLGDNRRLPDGEAGLNELFGRLKYSTRKKRREWSLTPKEVCIIVSLPCYFCLTPPDNSTGYGRSKFIHNHLDRRDRNIGYVPGNCIPCCKRCKAARGTSTFKEYAEWVVKLCGRVGGDNV